MAKNQAATIKAASKGPTKAQTARAEQLFGKGAVLEQPTEKHVIVEEQRKGERRGNNAMNFAVQQLSTPQAPEEKPHLETPPELTEDFQKALAELKEKFGVAETAPPAKATKPKAEKVQQNGITRPGANTLCGRIWAAADEITDKQHGAVATIGALKEHPATHDANEHTIKTQYARWRAFNGISGRLPKINAVHEERAPWNPPFGNMEQF